MSEEELLAQNETNLSLVEQALHSRRLWLVFLGLFAGLLWGWVVGFVVYFIFLLLVVRVSPLKVREKEGVILRRYQMSLVVLQKRLLRALDRVVMAFMHMGLLTGVVFAQEQQQQQQQTQQPQEVYRTESILFIKEEELRKIIKELERKEKIIRQQEDLEVGGEVELFLRGVNHFTYHPNMPLLFVFDREIKHVLLQTSSARAVFDGNVLFVSPPLHEDGRFFGFAVILQDGNAYYFAGQKVSVTDRRKQVTLHYRFRTPGKLTHEEVIVQFLQAKGRCPHDGESFSLEGKNYRFRKLKETVIRDANEVYCHGAVYRLESF